MTSATFLLATDLDGTFLGGTDEQRAALYGDLAARRDVLLIFVTGRDIDFIAELIEMPGMPRPHYVIGDVGTSIYDGATLEPITALEADIAQRWGAANARIMELLANESGLRLQMTTFRHRVSYDYNSAQLAPRTVAKIEAAGFDCLLSADRFLDVLPPGIAKGPTLNRLIDELGFDRDRVLVAGDTINDLSLFETGLKGVAVGNAEPRLLAAVAARANVYCSSLPGAAGISDALIHYGFDEETTPAGAPP
jgi:HAD superfamily hydrolase (TIGR01484 family)